MKIIKSLALTILLIGVIIGGVAVAQITKASRPRETVKCDNIDAETREFVYNVARTNGYHVIKHMLVDSFANIRTQPSVNSKIIGITENDYAMIFADSYTLSSDGLGWYYIIQLFDDGYYSIGWACEDALSIVHSQAFAPYYSDLPYNNIASNNGEAYEEYEIQFN